MRNARRCFISAAYVHPRKRGLLLAKVLRGSVAIMTNNGRYLALRAVTVKPCFVPRALRTDAKELNRASRKNEERGTGANMSFDSSADTRGAWQFIYTKPYSLGFFVVRGVTVGSRSCDTCVPRRRSRARNVSTGNLGKQRSG